MKNMNLKKTICTLLAVLMIATMSFGLMACKNTDDGAATTEATATGTVDPTGETGEDAGATGDATEPTSETAGDEVDATEATGETVDPTATTEANNGHVHNYTKEVIPPLCEVSGYDVYTCECGASYKDGYYKPVGHGYVKTVVAPTATEQGYTRHKCAYCDYYYDDTYVPATGTVTGSGNTSRIPSEKDVAAAVVKYVNQLRTAQGSATATSIPGLTRIAEERAQQIVYDFRHDESTLRALCEKYQYGEFVDATQYGGTQKYYTFGGAEAIGKGNVYLDPDELGQMIAEGFKNSAGHWRYVGDGANAYIGVGIAYNAEKDTWFCCINLSKENYG